MLREKHKWKPHKCESTDAEHRGGATRSSDEGSVMVLERRGSIVQLEQEVSYEELCYKDLVLYDCFFF